VRTLKTSEDDLFSLLTATGSDTVGDVSIAAVGETPREHSPSADIAHLESASFAELLAQSLHEHGLPKEATIAGVQPKLSAAMISFPLRSKQKGRSYILKLTPPEYPRLAENEAFFMRLAKRVGFDVAKHVLVRDRNGMSGLLVERFDRVRLADGQTRHLPQEDACQLLGRYPADKYRLTLSEVAAALEVCSAPLPEQLKLLRIQAFSYLIANGDMHAKNVSVQTLGARVCLTPLYDVLSTLPYGDRSLALAMEGRDTHLKATHFIALGERLGVRAKAVQQMLSQLVTKLAPHAAELGEIGFDAKKTAHLERTMRERLSDLAP
jgi:serine/threonine-protein kinase HipA